jgi:hypothetical protein
MISFDLPNFMHSLVSAIATAASLVYSTTPRQIWRGRADESAAADPYAVMSAYPGPGTAWDAEERPSIQCMVVGTSGEAAERLAGQIYAALRDNDGRPKQNWTLNGLTTAGVADGTYRIIGIDVAQRPGRIGVDERGRVMVAFNVTMGVGRR